MRERLKGHLAPCNSSATGFVQAIGQQSLLTAAAVVGTL